MQEGTKDALAEIISAGRAISTDTLAKRCRIPKVNAARRAQGLVNLGYVRRVVPGVYDATEAGYIFMAKQEGAGWIFTHG